MAFSDQLTRFFQFKDGGQKAFGVKDPYVFKLEDDTFLVCDPTDTTKCVRLDAGNITTGTTRVFNFADSDVGGGGAVAAGEQYVYQSAAKALANDTALNAMFTAAHDTFTVAAATTYRFDLVARLTTGATSHTTAFGLIGAGATTTFTSINLESICSSAADATLAASQQASIIVATAQVIAAASTAVKTNIVITGSFQVLAGGTIIPSIQFSADPTGTCQTDIGSYCSIYPIGSNTFAGTSGWS